MDKAKKEVRGFQLIFGYLGVFLFLIGALNLVPLLMLAFYPNESGCWYLFAIPSLGYVAIGALLYFLLLFHRKRARFARFENSQLLLLAWIMAVLAGALPFFLGNCFGLMKMNFSESVFESASAFSTTGLTVFKDYVDTPNAFAPHVFCFHRSLMQFIGGVGLVLLLESVLGSSSTSLYMSEGHSDKLLPSIAKSARLIFGIYFGYTALGSLALWLAGMDLFDAVNHSMCALSGGGMSTHSSSVAYFRNSSGNGVLPANSIAIEIILMALVIMSGISFLLHTFLLRFKWKKFAKDDEVRFAFCSMLFASIVMSVSGTMNLMNINGGDFFSSFGQGIRESVFYVIASATTSGFANTSLQGMLNLGKPLLWTCTVLMLIGGGAGSCGGGIKQYRVCLCMKDLWYSLKYRFTPSHQINPRTTYRYGKLSPLGDDTVKEAHNYSLLFLIVFGLSVLILIFLPEFDAEEAAFDVASGMSNTGLAATDFVSYGLRHPAEYPIALWTLSAGMILGRLEIMPLFYALRNVREEIAFQKHEKRMLKEKLLDENEEFE
mgnify:CR=1 FL=1